MAYGNIRGITIEINGDTSKLTTALSKADEEARAVTRTLRDINRAMKFDTKNGPELAAQKQRELARAIETTKARIDTLKAGQAAMTEEFKKTAEGSRAYDNLTREIWRAEEKLKSFEAQSDRTYQTLTKIRDNTTKFGKSVTDVGSNLTTKLSAPLVAAGGVATKFATDFDTAMVGVRKTTDMSDKEFQDMKQSIVDMSKEMPASAVEIANVAEQAGQLGIQKENIIDFSKTIIDLGNSTDLTAEQAASSFARFANITGMPQSEFSNLGSTVVQLGNNLATTEPEIVDLGMRLAGAGSQAGLTYAEIMGLAGAMSSVGVSAEAGGSAMSTVMTKIGKSVSNSDEKLQSFARVSGMSAEEFATAWKESPAKALEAFITGLGNAKESGENVDNILSELGITGIRETDTLKRLGGAGDLLGKAFNMANESFKENTALSNEAQQKYDSFEAKLETFKNKVTAVGIAIGEKLMPYVEKATDFLGKLADAISNADPRTIGIIVGVGAFLAALGPVLVIIGKIATVIGTVSGALAILAGGVTTGATPAMIGLAKVFGIVSTGLTALKAVIVAHPLIAILVGVATFVVPLIIKNWDSIKEFLINTWNTIKETAQSIWSGIIDFLSNIWTGVKDAWSLFWDPIGEWFSEKINLLVETIQPIVETFVNVFKVAWMLIQEVFSTAWEVISGLLVQNFQIWIELIKTIFGPLVEFFTTLWEGIKTVFINTWTAISEYLNTAWQAFSTLCQTIFNGIKEFISGVWNTIKEITSTVWEAIKGIVTTYWQAVFSQAQSIFNSLKEFISGIWNTVKEITSTVWNGIKSVITSIWETIKSVVSSAIESVKSVVSSVWETIKGITDSAWNTIKSYIEGPINTARGIVDGVVNGIQSTVSRVWDSIASTTSRIWENIKEAISGPINRAKDAVHDAIERIKGILDIDLPFPDIKLPHFGIEGEFSLTPPSIPHFTVDWYKKGGIFTKPTLFNTPTGLKGVGEAGAEAVLPIEKLYGFIDKAIKANMNNGGNSGVTVTGNTFNVREEQDIEKVARELYTLIDRKRRGVGLG